MRGSESTSLDKKNDRTILVVMATKGDETRQAILAKAFDLACVGGLAGLTIGRLAEHTGLSKSGLFAHFGSKEALEVAIVEEASRQFIESVMIPALRKPRGEPRVRELFERWLAWGHRPGGCFFVAASAELDDRPGPARDALVRASKDWIDAIATAASIARTEGHFAGATDPQQFAFDAYSIMLGSHFFDRFIKDPTSVALTRRSFEALLDRVRA
jgi:AcrR family transcriptional regulator